MSSTAGYGRMRGELTVLFANVDQLLESFIQELSRQQTANFNDEAEEDEANGPAPESDSNNQYSEFDSENADGVGVPAGPNPGDHEDAQETIQVHYNDAENNMIVEFPPRIDRPGSPQRQVSRHRISGTAPRLYICVAVEDIDEEEPRIQRRPRRQLPERFPTAKHKATLHHRCARESHQAQRHPANACLNTCMRFPLTERSCLKCDMHTLVYYLMSCLHLCNIVWELVPVTERPEDWDLTHGPAAEPRRMCGWNWWWRYVEDRTSGEIYVWKAVQKCWQFVSSFRQ